MATIKEVINKLQRLNDEYGDVEINIYQSFDKKIVKIDIDNIYYDGELKDVYIGIY